MNDFTALPHWAWLAGFLTIITHVVALGMAMHKLGQWVGKIDATLHAIHSSLQHLMHEGDELRERVAQHQTKLGQHDTRLAHLEAYHEPGGSHRSDR